MSKIEAELVAATKYKARKDVSRQDFLAGLLRAAEKMRAEDYDKLTDDAAHWYEVGAEALNSREVIPDFNAEEDELHAENDPITEFEEEPEQASSANGAATDEPLTSPEDDAEVEAPPAPKTAGSKKPKKAAKAPKPPKPHPEGEEAAARYANLTGERNRYGVTVGTKTHDAIVMYEAGASVNEVEEKIGGRHANILKKLAAEGHRVEKDAATKRFKLTHADDLEPKS